MQIYSKLFCIQWANIICWLLTDLLPWHISISEIQLNISITFSDTLIIHSCHPYIYLKLQRTIYQGLLTAVWKYNSVKPFPSAQNLSSPFPRSCKLSVSHTYLLTHTRTHTHTSLDSIIIVRCTKKYLNDWVLFRDTVKLQRSMNKFKSFIWKNFSAGHW